MKIVPAGLLLEIYFDVRKVKGAENRICAIW
jgi:hypothetical protein